MSVVPGCWVAVHGDGLGMTAARSVINHGETKLIKGGCEALVLSVEPKDDGAWCNLMSSDYGLFRVENTRFAIIWYPEQ